MGTNGTLNTEADKDLIAESVMVIAKQFVRFGVKDVFVSSETVNTRAVLLSSMQLIAFFKIYVQRICFILLITQT